MGGFFSARRSPGSCSGDTPALRPRHSRSQEPHPESSTAQGGCGGPLSPQHSPPRLFREPRPPWGAVPPRQPAVPRLGEAAASPGPSGEFRFHSRRRWPCLLLLPLPHLQLELQFEALAGPGAGREWEWEEGARGSQRKPESWGLRGGAGCTGRPGPEPLGIAGGRGQEAIAGGGGSQRRWSTKAVAGPRGPQPVPQHPEVSGHGASWELGTRGGTARGVGTAGIAWLVPRPGRGCHLPSRLGHWGSLPSLGALVSEHTGTGEGCQDSGGLSPVSMRAWVGAGTAALSPPVPPWTPTPVHPIPGEHPCDRRGHPREAQGLWGDVPAPCRGCKCRGHPTSSGAPAMAARWQREGEDAHQRPWNPTGSAQSIGGAPQPPRCARCRHRRLVGTNASSRSPHIWSPAL